MRKVLAVLGAALLVMTLGLAEAGAQLVRAVSHQAAGTITTTDAFQRVLAANPNRLGCAFQNQGSHTMYLFFGSGAQTKANSIQVGGGIIVNCNAGNLVLTDEIWVTGTSADAFLVNYQ